jgi:DNA replication protein DnaC
MDEELSNMLKHLRLSALQANWNLFLQTAAKSNLSHDRLLRHVVEQEYNLKKENSRKMRLQRAKIPEQFVIETFPFARQPKLQKKKVLAIYDSFEYVEKCLNVIWIGPPGTGKSGLATSFLTQAINRGSNGLFVTFPKLIAMLYNSIADHSEDRLLKKLAAYDCLLVDEVGYVEVEPVQVGLFFTLMHERHKKKTTLITSNLGFSQWGSFLKNDHLTAALLDRLTETSYVINMKDCQSLRAKLDE